jgi:hypothetical protein
MTITKTTLNYALARGLELVQDENDDVVALFESDVDSEHMVSFWVLPCGGFSYKGNVYLPEHIRYELPHYMKDEKALRLVLDFISKELKKMV